MLPSLSLDTLFVYLALGGGALATALTLGVQFRGLPSAFSANEASFRRAHMAASVGMGSVIASLLAVESGGPAALVWMWLATLGGMALSYAEVRFVPSPASPSAAEASLPPSRPNLFAHAALGLFSLLALFWGLSVGGALQSQVASRFVADGLFGDPTFYGFALALLAAPAILKPQGRWRRTLLRTAPFALLLYTVVLLVALVGRASELASVLAELPSIWRRDAALSGLSIGGVTVALQQGFLRATLASESGLGVASLRPVADEHLAPSGPQHSASRGHARPPRR